ncbi:MAG: pilus assembly protein PilM [Acidobacteria bacterium]|nr:pilus assembly protein PilM [Acidobacteriota bacterium]
MKLPPFLRTPPPNVALEISPRRLVAVCLSGGGGARPQVSGWAVEPLPEGAIVASLTAPNIARPADVARAIERVWERLDQRPRRIALVVPDSIAKVSFVKFQQVPARAADLDELVKFQIRKAAPFRVEESQIAFAAGASGSDGQEFVVVQARRDIVAEYEEVCVSAGAAPGVVELATIAVSECVRAMGPEPTGDWLLIHATADSAALAIFRGDDLVFFRHRGADGDAHLGELAHQTAMYYQDRLGGRGFSRVVVGGATPEALASATWRDIQARLGVTAEAIDPERGITVRARAPWSPDTMEAATPALGLALSLRSEA